MTQEEKFIILRAIVKYLQDNEASQNIETSLIGVSYLFPKEKMGSLFYDGRLLAFYLNCCLSSRKHGLGISICLGDTIQSCKRINRKHGKLQNELTIIYSKNIPRRMEDINRE